MFDLFILLCSPPDLAAEAESGDAAVPVAVVAAAAAAPVQSGEGAPEDAAGRAAEGAPEAPAAPAGGPLLLHAGHGARQAERPEGRSSFKGGETGLFSPSARSRHQHETLQSIWEEAVEPGMQAKAHLLSFYLYLRLRY